jgi:hypothetical protein
MSEEVNKELAKHLISTLLVFILVELVWLLKGDFSFTQAFLFFVGLGIGSFLLDLDHLVYWFFLYPNKTDSLEAKRLVQEKKYRQLLLLLGRTHKAHTSLVFHHFLFQLILLPLVLFVFTSTTSILGRGLLLSLSLHLLVDQIDDYRQDYRHLSRWLFARVWLGEVKIPQQFLKIYIAFYSLVFLLMIYWVI